jgi:hypothetical protein
MALPPNPAVVVASVERSHNRHAPLKRGDGACEAIMGMDEVEVLLQDDSPDLTCGPQVVEHVTTTVEVE